MEEKEVVSEQKSEEPEITIYDFLGLTDSDTIEVVGNKIQEKLGISLFSMGEKLSQILMDKAEELTLELPNIAPLGNYGKLIEDNDGMTDFLKTEACKIEHWQLYGVRASDVNKDLISFTFANVAVDDGESLEGFVFATKTGKIKHAFVQVKE
jgi:hypothetical protein